MFGFLYFEEEKFNSGYQTNIVILKEKIENINKIVKKKNRKHKQNRKTDNKKTNYKKLMWLTHFLRRKDL